MNCPVNRGLVSVWVASLALAAAVSHAETVVLPLEVTSPLHAGTIPMDVDIDFASIIAKAKQPGVLDPNTVQVMNLTTGARVSACAQSTRSLWRSRACALVAEERGWEEMRDTLQDLTGTRRAATACRYAAHRGGGPAAVLRSAATRHRQLAADAAGDLNGDGARDLVATDYSTSEPLWPERIPNSWSPFLRFSGVQDKESPSMLFGNAVRLRYRDKAHGPEQFFISGYMHTDAADMNGDGLPDLAFGAAEKYA